jgi:hypothetical protein
VFDIGGVAQGAAKIAAAGDVLRAAPDLARYAVGMQAEIGV